MIVLHSLMPSLDPPIIQQMDSALWCEMTMTALFSNLSIFSMFWRERKCLPWSLDVCTTLRLAYYISKFTLDLQIMSERYSTRRHDAIRSSSLYIPYDEGGQ